MKQMTRFTVVGSWFITMLLPIYWVMLLCYSHLRHFFQFLLCLGLSQEHSQTFNNWIQFLLCLGVSQELLDLEAMLEPMHSETFNNWSQFLLRLGISQELVDLEQMLEPIHYQTFSQWKATSGF